MISLKEIDAAAIRLSCHLKKTPLITNSKLNSQLSIIANQKTESLPDIHTFESKEEKNIQYQVQSHRKINLDENIELFLKMENQQETNSFKARGAFNAILAYFEKHHKFPEKIVAQSTGNHAQAVAMAGKKFGIPVLVYMAKSASLHKINATKSWGAQVVVCDKRSEANLLAEKRQEEGYFFIHPSDNDDVILGQATCGFEALLEVKDFEAIFAPCGGGGLLAGCYLAKELLQKDAKIFGCEPSEANDAARSYAGGEIVGFEDSPKTIADGVRTLKVSNRCFNYLKKLDGFLEISESEIDFWQKNLSEILKAKIEPTAALSVAGVANYLRNNLSESRIKRRFLAIISGGNL